MRELVFDPIVEFPLGNLHGVAIATLQYILGYRAQDQSYITARQRSRLIRKSGDDVRLMQKALTQMNIKLQHVVSDIAGATGMRIIRAMLEGGNFGKTLVAVGEDPTLDAALQARRASNNIFG